MLTDDDTNGNQCRNRKCRTGERGEFATPMHDALLNIGHRTTTKARLGCTATHAFVQDIIEFAHCNSSFKRVLARLRDDFTVPIAMPSVAAISASVDWR